MSPVCETPPQPFEEVASPLKRGIEFHIWVGLQTQEKMAHDTYVSIGKSNYASQCGSYHLSIIMLVSSWVIITSNFQLCIFILVHGVVAYK